MREELDSILAKHTSQPLERIHEDTDRDFFMSGEQAKEYGIIDEVIAKAEKILRIEAKTTGKGEKRGNGEKKRI
jgi:ATP-dependent Clp protease protease subunit